MVVSIFPVGGTSLPGTTPGGASHAAAETGGQPGVPNNTKIVQSGQQASGSAANNERGNSSANDQGDGGETALLARNTSQEKVVLPAPPADELETPVAPSDLLRYAHALPSANETDQPPRPTPVGAQERLNDESLSERLTPPAEERISEDVSALRSMAAENEVFGVDLRR